MWFVSGVTWIRYHVAFDNGVEIANVDGGDVRDRKGYLAEQATADQEALAAEREVERERRPRRAPVEPRRRPRRPLSPEHTMKLGMQIDYTGGFKESAAKVSAYEKAGLDVAWVAEAYGFDGPTFMGYLAATTETITIGSGILPIYTRTPTLLAMTAAGMDALTDGRFILGLGASGPQVIEGFHGVKYDAPLGRTREIVDICHKV